MHLTDRTAGITVGELIAQLKVFNPEAELYMSGLQFYRLKRRGDDRVQLEFNQALTQLEDGSWVLELADPELGDVEGGEDGADVQ